MKRSANNETTSEGSPGRVSDWRTPLARALRGLAATVCSLLLAGILLPMLSDRQHQVALLPALAVCLVLTLPWLLIMSNMGKNRRLEGAGWLIQVAILAMALS